MGTLTSMPELLSNIQPPETLLAAGTVAIIWFMPEKVKKVVPPQLVALVVGTIVSLTLFPGVEIRRIGEIPSGFPSLVMPQTSHTYFEIFLPPLDDEVLWRTSKYACNTSTSRR